MSNYVKQTLSAAASGVTPWVDCKSALCTSITIVIPAGPVGTLTLEGSDDQATIIAEGMHGTTPSAAAARDITTLAEVAGTIDPNNSAVTVVVQTAVPAGFLRFRYVRSSGTGTLTFHYSIK